MNSSRQSLLVCLGAGIGNAVLATPLMEALHELGWTVDVWLAADYPETSELLRPWAVVKEVLADSKAVPRFTGYERVVPAIPPFYWPQYARRFPGTIHVTRRPPDALFYQDEQEYYISFARALGYPAGTRPLPSLPIAPSGEFGVSVQTLVLAPGCKTGEMAAKRWPYFPQLADAFADVVVVGTLNDLSDHGGKPLAFPPHVRSFVGQLTLRQTAELLAGAGIVVANDSGLAHIATAVGTPIIIIFGPTPDRTLGHLPPNVTVLRRGLPCEPCWFKARFQACAHRLTCLQELKPDTVIRELERQGWTRMAGLNSRKE